MYTGGMTNLSRNSDAYTPEQSWEVADQLTKTANVMLDKARAIRRQVMRDYVDQGYSIRGVASSLGVSPSSVQDALRRAGEDARAEALLLAQKQTEATAEDYYDDDDD
jgi:Homeodomain-like domain